MRRGFLGCGLALVLLSSCSVLLDKRADQCTADGDCSQFANTHCDLVARLCVSTDQVAMTDPPEAGAMPDASPLDAGHKVPDAGADTGPFANDAGSVEASAGDAAIDGCVGPSGCYACKPSNDIQYENGCTSSRCRPFDNQTRLKFTVDGGLRPLTN